MGLAEKLMEVYRTHITRLGLSVSIYKNTVSTQLKRGLNPFAPQKIQIWLDLLELHSIKVFDGLRQIRKT